MSATTLSIVDGWNDILHYCEHHKPDVIYVGIGCSQKRHEYGKHTAQECPPFVRNFVSVATAVCILIDPDLEDDLYVLRDLTDEELSRTRIITVRRNFYWENPDDMSFIHSLCGIALRGPDTYLIVQDYSGEELRRHYPIQHFGPALLRKVVFDVSYMGGGCWLDFGKVRLERDMDGGFLQPPYMPLSSAIAVASPEVIQFLAERRYYTLVSYVFGYYRRPVEPCEEHSQRPPSADIEPRDWCTPETVALKLREICAAEAYGVPVSVTKENLRVLASRMVEDFAHTAGAELTAAEIARMLDEPTEKVLPRATSTLRIMINEMVS